MYALLNQELNKVTDRLAALLAEEDDPGEAMVAAAEQLAENGVANLSVGPRTTPAEFAAQAVRDNPLMMQHLQETQRRVEPLSRFETAEELIQFLLPSSDSLS